MQAVYVVMTWQDGHDVVLCVLPTQEEARKVAVAERRMYGARVWIHAADMYDTARDVRSAEKREAT